MILRNLIRELVYADAPPGREAEVRDIIIRELKPITDDVTIDPLGNVIAKRVGQTDKTLMLIAHQDDDWALIVRHIDEQGFLRFRRVVGHRWNLLGQRVHVHGKQGKRIGVIGLTAPHIIPTKEQERGYKPLDEEMFIDCGARTRAEAEALGIQLGQFVTAVKHFEELPQGRLLGNCFDDRVGLAVMIEVLQQIKDMTLPVSITVVASVQEELGTRGAHPATFTVQPDYAIALDVAPTGDHPGLKPEKVPVRLGAGPALLIADQFHVTSSTFNDWLSNLAATHGIPLQRLALRAPIHFGTDAAAVEIVRKGSMVTALLAPTRYFHTTNQIVDYTDLENMVKLLSKVIQFFAELTSTD